MKKRISSMLLVICMVFTLMPSNVFAVEGSVSDKENLCEHHTAHDAHCGYVEAEPGHPCEHEHTADCYTDELIYGCIEARKGRPCTFVCEICNGTDSGKEPEKESGPVTDDTKTPEEEAEQSAVQKVIAMINALPAVDEEHIGKLMDFVNLADRLAEMMPLASAATVKVGEVELTYMDAPAYATTAM